MLFRSEREKDGRRGFIRALVARRAGGQVAIIAEAKKASPSRGLIAPDFDPVAMARHYQADGTFVPAQESDIAAAATGIPGPRLGIVADENVKVNDQGSTVLIGISGQVDQDRLLVGAKKFPDLTDEQKVHLREQLEVWGFALEVVQQS